MVELAGRFPIFDEEHEPLALHVRERGRFVVLRNGIRLGIVRNESHLVRVKIGLIDVLTKWKDALSRLKFLGFVDQGFLSLAGLSHDANVSLDRSSRARA